MSLDVQVPDAPETVASSLTTLPAIPPLENGDYLTRDEFERRYNAMPRVKVAELIEGRVFVPLPVHARYHGEPHSSITGWLGMYSAYTPNIGGYNNTTLRLDETNEPQPDVILLIDEIAGGQTSTSPDDIIEGAPELIAEVAGSNASHDLRDKFHAYCRNGVREYIVWSIHERQLNWFRLEAGEYVPIHPDSDGIIRSRIFPGLWLDVEALLKGDMAAVLTTLQQGLASEEHTAFVQRLTTADKQE